MYVMILIWFDFVYVMVEKDISKLKYNKYKEL